MVTMAIEFGQFKYFRLEYCTQTLPNLHWMGELVDNSNLKINLLNDAFMCPTST